MKVTLNWLQQYVEAPGTPAELTEHFTQLGLEVEGVENHAGEFTGIVVAQIISREKHPNADKLSVCRVNDGQGERQIVCGAQNFQPGDKVPLILPGSTLPPKSSDTPPFVIKVGKIRGVESHGMMCSAGELGLDPEALGLKTEDGLLILRPDASVGQPLAEYLGRSRGDVVFDLEVTPNRPDLNSVIGIAREIAAVTGRPLSLPKVPLILGPSLLVVPPLGGPSELLSAGDGINPALQTSDSWPVSRSKGNKRIPANTEGKPASALVAVQLEAPDLCPRYTARVILGVKVGPSPTWLRETLEKVGLRSVNNIVDVTNWVMLETGQPLHAFDYHLLAPGTDGRPTIVVRRATPGEKFLLLDGQEKTLTPENLLIADTEKGIALAGVMGGRNTGITPDTVDILLESAYFAPTHIRRTSKTLGLRTDASYRFERGAEVAACEFASRRCLQLILETAGGVPADGVVEAYPQPAEPKRIDLRYHRVNELLGLALSPGEIVNLLGRLELHQCPASEGNGEKQKSASFEIPSYRVDLKREVDLIEEVARMFGVEKIPSTPPRGAFGAHPFDQRYDEMARVREILTGLGLAEVQGQTLISSTDLPGNTADTAVRLSNPLSSDMDCLRPSLLPGLLTLLRHNRHRNLGDIQVFELGRTFGLKDGAVREQWRVGIALTGLRVPEFWSGVARGENCEFADLKGIVEELLERLGLRGVLWSGRNEATSLFLESAEITLGGKLVLGELGQLLPGLARSYDLRDPVLLTELDLDQALARGNPSRTFKPLPSFPAARRDLALIVGESVTHDAVLNALRRVKPANLERLELFDVFRGKPIPEGHKSLAYAFTYRAADRTLKDDEVNAAQTRVVEALKSTLNAQVRE